MPKQIIFSKEEFEKIYYESDSLQEAANKLKMHYNTFRKYIKKFNLKIKNTPKIGLKYKLEDIFNGLYPQYPTSKLHKRLIKEGIKEHRCEKCKNTEWQGCSIPLELHHKNGNRTDHRLENLELLCPNCHAQTDTFKAKNISHIFIKDNLLED